MDSILKKRLIGATVLIALAVIFLPMLVQESVPEAGVEEVPLAIPSEPPIERTRQLPLQLPMTGDSAAPLDVVPDPSAVVSVDTESIPQTDALAGQEATAPRGTDTEPAQVSAPAQGTAAPTPTGSKPPAVVANAPTTPRPSKPSADASEAGDKGPIAAQPSNDAGSGGFVVNLGAYTNLANAEKLVSELRAAGLAVDSSPLRIAGKPAVRLRLGPYARRSEAEQARLKALTVRRDLPATVLAVGTLPATSEASKGAAPDVGFVVQLGAFRNAAEADALLARLRQAGFTGLRDSVPGASGPLFRIRAGPTTSRAEADRLRAAIADKLHIEGVVLGHP